MTKHSNNWVSNSYNSARSFFVTTALLAFVAFSAEPAHAQQGPKAGKPNDNTPKPGVFLNGPMRWGRLVDIWAVDSDGFAVPVTKKNGQLDPLYTDIVVGESIGVSKTISIKTDPPVSYFLDSDPVSGATILIIEAEYNKNKKSPFQIALAEAEAAVGTIAVGNVTALPPFSVVPRDAAVILNFDRAINPKTIGPESVRFFVGNSTSQGQLPPAPFEGRYIWKPERPKTIIFDPAINALDDARVESQVAQFNQSPSKIKNINPQILPLNPQGFPASISTVNFNVAVFIPAQYNITAGITKILVASDGTALDTNKSLTKFSYTTSGATSDGIIGVARVFRSGGSTDLSKGFLADPTVPRLLGTQPILIQQVSSSVSLPSPNDSRVIKLLITTVGCDFSVHVGDSIQQGSTFAQITSINTATLTDADPSYEVIVDYLQFGAALNTTDPALITTPYDSTLSNFAGCFITMQPAPGTHNGNGSSSGVNPQTTITARFSKPIDTSRINPMRNFAVLTNAALTSPAGAGHFDLAIGNVIPSPDQKTLRFVSYLPFPHTNLSTEQLKFVIVGGSNGLTDLVGNGVDFGTTLFTVPFSLTASAPSNTSRNFNMIFDSLVDPASLTGALQVSGEVTKPSSTEISGRSTTHFSREADTSNVMVGVMAPPTAGITTPLNALGGRLQTVYRNVDLNLVIDSIQDIDLDVERLSWSPFAGHLNVSDFFSHVRIDLAHSAFYPDEIFSPVSGNQVYPNSGLTEQSFNANIFQIADHPSTAVYEGQLSLNQNLLYTVNSGTVMLPFPKFTKTYTWRDSSYGSKKVAGPAGGGANPDQYFLIIGAAIPTAPAVNRPWGPGAIPSVGLPLLLDFRVYPADDPNTKGLNGFLVMNALQAPTKPNFSVWSEGGLDANLSPKTVTPDVAPDGVTPSGSFFPPGSTAGTPGTKTTPGDGLFYVGRLDFAVKVSRVYTHFYDLSSGIVTNPTFVNTNTLLLPTVQPAGTSVKVAYRGASTVAGTALTDARCFDAYGDLYTGNAPVGQIPQPTITGCGGSTINLLVPPTGGSFNFTPDLTILNGKKFVQMQFNFTADIVNNVNARINAFGIAYSNP